uniref:Uncharacterized protein n=1 Tax=Arion vulgaris TaxID=1028688 RepID=A0A0B6ZQ84_9EUPU
MHNVTTGKINTQKMMTEKIQNILNLCYGRKSSAELVNITSYRKYLEVHDHLQSSGMIVHERETLLFTV